MYTVAREHLSFLLAKQQTDHKLLSVCMYRNDVVDISKLYNSVLNLVVISKSLIFIIIVLSIIYIA